MAARKASQAARRKMVPVGLFGLPRKTRRVAGPAPPGPTPARVLQQATGGAAGASGRGGGGGSGRGRRRGLGRRGGGAEPLEPRGFPLHRGEGRLAAPLPPVPLEIEEEEVLPRPLPQRARLDLDEVDAVRG